MLHYVYCNNAVQQCKVNAMQNTQQQQLSPQHDDSVLECLLECLAGRQDPTNDEEHFAYKLGELLRKALAEEQEAQQKI